MRTHYSTLDMMVIRLVRDFDNKEAIWYSTEINPKTGTSYVHDARRAYIKYHIEQVGYKANYW